MIRAGVRRTVCVVAAGAVASVGLSLTSGAAAASSELFFSEYVEGSSNNKALEIFNSTGARVDLAAGGYNVQMFFNGSTSAGLTINLDGSVADGDVFVVAHSGAGPAILAAADQTNGAGWFNGDDALVLRSGTTVLDVIGEIGFDPGSEWGSGLTSTADNTLRRKEAVTAGDPDGGNAFDPAVEWDGFPTDTFAGLGAHPGEPSPEEPEQPPYGSCADPYTSAYEIQGSGPEAARTGTVTTQGVVVGDYEGASPRLRGFYLQDRAGDGNAATSDAVFVFNANEDEVSVGDVVRVTGTAGEFQGQTQVGAFADGVTVCSSDATVAPTPVVLPFAEEADKERHEGMLVRLPQTLTVTEHFQLGRFGQVVLSSAGKLAQPTNVVEPGAPANALQAANNLNRIIVDDALNNQNPDPILFGRDGEPLSASNTLRGGDTATGIVGVMTYTWAGNSASGNAFRVRPIGALGGAVEFEAANPRSASPAEVGGDLQVASFNVLNYFNTFRGCRGGTNGAPMDCRGADNAFELERQAAKIVAAIRGLDADVVGVIEMENDGYGPTSALQDLVDRLNAVEGSQAYDLIDVDALTGQVDALGDDAIKVGLIYRPADAMPVGRTAVLNTDSFVNGNSGAPRNRPALAQTFQDADGGRVTVVVNHLKSKGSDCNADGDPDVGDGQGNCNQTRLDAAIEMAEWLQTDPTAVDDSDVLVTGDLNAYAMEDPISALRDAGYTDLVRAFEGDDAYSYVFDGQWGYLDHALASESLRPQVTGTTTWHINADEPNVLDYNTNFKSAGQVASLYAPDPYRSSDHDPVLVGLELRVGDRVSDGFVTGSGRYAAGDGTAVFDVGVLYTPRALAPTGEVSLTVPGLGVVTSSDIGWLATDVDTGLATFRTAAALDGTGGYTLTGYVTDRGRQDDVRFVLESADGSVMYDSGVSPLVSGNLRVH